MYKKGVSLVLGLGLVLVLFCLPVFAADPPQESLDEISITTYYPSPYGTYNELSTNKFAVGYLTSSDQPTKEGAIRLKPQAGDPLSWAPGKEGEIAYSSSKDMLYVNNESTWVAQGGAGAGVACTVICNGSCPAPADGWTLKEATGVSGGYRDYGTYGVAAGRCAYRSGNEIGPGTERMCCYFKG